VRVKGGKARWREWHLDSIREAGRVLGLTVEDKELGKVPSGDGIWRWFVTETGTRTWWSPGIEASPETYVLDLAKTGVWSTSWEARFKTLSYLSRVQAKGEAGEAEEERVMLNERGEMASAAMANLFWVREGKLRTPARESGCRAGTVRRWVLERSGQNVEEGKWKTAELEDAEEIFLTNARIGIKPVRSWQGRKVGGMGLAKKMAEAFWRESDQVGD